MPLHGYHGSYRLVVTHRSEISDVQQRIAEKERARRNDAQALVSGAKTAEQLRRECEAFAFPRGRARINLRSAASLF